MKITKVTLRNFRGVSDLQLDLESDCTILVGVNGAGKTTILDSIAILLSWLTARSLTEHGKGKSIQPIDIQNQKKIAELKIQVEKVEWSIAKVRKGMNDSARSQLAGLSEYIKELQQDWEPVSVGVPVIAYYPVNRAVLDIPLRIRNKHVFDKYSIYDDFSKSGSGANFRIFFEWFREREDIENENRRNDLVGQEAKEFPDKQLEAVRKALTLFLPNYEKWMVKRQPLRMIVQKEGQELRVDQLSDGEKGLVALVGDIARRLAIANSYSKEPLKGTGIVLIDEIDLHLHPSWQRMVVPKLLEIFPNIQFIISTHSPQILSEVKPQKLRLLEQKEGNLVSIIPKQSKGLNSLQVLQRLMNDKGINQEVEDKLKALFGLIDEENFDQAKKLIEELEDEFQGEIPALVEAETMIHFLEPDNESD